MNPTLNKPKIWGLVGLGWLGSALAEKLSLSGQKTWGTHRNSFDFKKDPFPDTYCDVLFLNTPPLLDLSPDEYVNKIFLHPNSKIIFTSSISVYGHNTTAVNESSPTCPVTDSANWLCEVENLLQLKFEKQLLILRLGGLIGKKRHPINFLSGKKNIAGSEDVINLIHLSDLICIILLLEKMGSHHLVNIVTPFHPTKNSYYNEWAQKLNLPTTDFTKNEVTKKEIGSHFLPLIYPNWLVPKLDSF